MSYNADLKANNVDLQSILNTINTLPSASGMVLEMCAVEVYLYSADGFYAYVTIEDGGVVPKFKPVKAGAATEVIHVVKNSILLLYAPGNSSNYYGGYDNLNDITRPGRSDDYNAFCYWVTGDGYITCA